MDEVGDDWVSGVRPPPTSQVATHLPSSVSFLPTSRAVRVRVFLVLGRVYIGAFCGNKSIVDSVSLAPNRIVSPPPPPHRKTEYNYDISPINGNRYKSTPLTVRELTPGEREMGEGRGDGDEMRMTCGSRYLLGESTSINVPCQQKPLCKPLKELIFTGFSRWRMCYIQFSSCRLREAI